MSTDLSKHQKIIDSFRGKVNKPSFDVKFTQSTKQLDKTEKFLLKMELKRLASPCTRCIDLRGLVDGECKLFEYNGQSHFLDDVAIRVFNESVAEYGGYTLGVYEVLKTTKNNFRVIYNQAKQKLAQPTPDNTIEALPKSPDKIQYPVSVYPLNQYYDRIEERMNFVIPLIITLSDNKKKSACSIDLSTHGVKFRITSSTPLYIDQKLSITFKGFEDDFKFSNSEVLAYQVKNIHSDQETQLIGCQRINSAEDDEFQKFLIGYIQGNKRRYKINLDNTIAALQARSFEQYILRKINELPIFFQKINNTLLPRYVLTTNNNQNTFQYWQDEKNNANLHFLADNERCSRLLKRYKQGKSLLVYSFVHKHQDKDFFYTIDDEQLKEETDFARIFLSFAAKKESFRVTKLTYLAINQASVYTPFSVSNTINLKKQLVNLPPSEEAINCINGLAFIVVASDITHQTSIEQYQNFSNNDIDVNRLKKFGHKRLTEKVLVEELGITYGNQRQEPRFMYSTPVILECEQVKWQGNSVDFSVSGVKVELDKPAVLSVGDIVYLTLPNLQKITSSHDLKKLPYKVVKLNTKKTIVNFRIHVIEHQHTGRTFFKLLIDKNKDKLKTDGYAFLVPGLADALRTSYSQSMQVPTLMVQSSGSRYKVEALVANDTSSDFLQQLHNLSDRRNYYNFYPLLTKLYKESFIESRLKKLIIDKGSVTEVLYIAIAKKVEQIDKEVKVKFDSELNTPEMRKYFIKQALKKGYFFCIQLQISRTGKPDLDYLNTELSYVSTYAIHRSKQIEQDIYSVVASIEYTDITDEVLFSHGL